MSPPGPQRRLAAVQRHAGNGRISGRPGDASGTAAPDPEAIVGYIARSVSFKVEHKPTFEIASA
jgi:hypothetical protein